MTTRDALDPEFVESVITHMNKDHSDACLCIVKAFSTETTANEVLLHSLDRDSLYFKVISEDETAADHPAPIMEIRIDFPQPLRNELQVRNALIGMASQAREVLAQRDALAQQVE